LYFKLFCEKLSRLRIDVNALKAGVLFKSSRGIDD